MAGKLKTIIAHSTANLFNGSSHTFDAVNRLNGDAKPISIMGEIQVEDGTTEDLNSGRHSSMSMITLADGSKRPLLDKDEHGQNILRSDPVGHGIVEYVLRAVYASSKSFHLPLLHQVVFLKMRYTMSGAGTITGSLHTCSTLGAARSLKPSASAVLCQHGTTAKPGGCGSRAGSISSTDLSVSAGEPRLAFATAFMQPELIGSNMSMSAFS